MNEGTDTSQKSKDSELEERKRAAEIAEAEVRIEKARKELVQTKKETEAALNSDLQHVENQKAIQQAGQAAAEAQKARFTAGLPVSSTKPLDGTVEVDDKAGYFSDILAFESVSANADKIARRIAAHVGDGQRIYLVKQPDYNKASLQLSEIEQRFQTFDKMFDALSRRYEVADSSGYEVLDLETGKREATEFIPGTSKSEVFGIKAFTPSLALSAIPAAIGALADVAALFRTDRTVNGRAPTVEDDALIAAVAGALVELVTKNVAVQVPSLNTKASPAILELFKRTREKSDKSAWKLAEIRTALAAIGVDIESITARIAEVKNELKQLEKGRGVGGNNAHTEIERLKTELTGLRESLKTSQIHKAQGEVATTLFEAAIKAFSEFANQLVSVPDGGTFSPLISLAETSVLRDLPEESLILTVGVASKGGEVETKRRIWGSGRIYHRAGTACTYTLFSNNGTVVDSGLVVSNRQAREGRRFNME